MQIVLLIGRSRRSAARLGRRGKDWFEMKKKKTKPMSISANADIHILGPQTASPSQAIYLGDADGHGEVDAVKHTPALLCVCSTWPGITEHLWKAAPLLQSAGHRVSPGTC